MNIYKNKEGGFSGTGAILGAVVGIALGVVTGGASLAVYAVAGGAAGGFLGDSGAKEGEATGDGTAQGQNGTATTTPCQVVQTVSQDLQAKYAEAQKNLAQAQQNLSDASKNGTTTSNDYNSINNACYNSGTQSQCGQANDGGCNQLQDKCNNLQALIDSTNQAACQLQATTMSILKGGSASSTANPYTNAFTIGLNPETIPVGGETTLVTTISLSKLDQNLLKSFSVAVYDSKSTLLGNLISNTSVKLAAGKQVTLQYNLKLPATIGPGKYTVKIYNDDNPEESEKATLTITGTSTATSTNSSSSQNSSFNVSLSPTSIGQGGSFTVNAAITSAAVTAYTIEAYQNNLGLGPLAKNVGITSSTRPATIQQTFKTSATIPPGVYSVRISDANNGSNYSSASLTVTAGTATNSSNGTSSNGTNNTGSGICTLTTNLKYGDKDANTGGQVSNLQQFLLSKNYYAYQVTGNFGNITKAAVKAFQSANGVPSTGLVGPLTRAAIKKGC